MDTKKWGPSGWVFLHAIAENYDPKIHDAKTFERFFTDIGGVLPCIHCRNSYQEFSRELPIEPFLKRSSGLAEWLYLIHNKVNKKLRDQGLSVEADPSFEAIRERYQNFKVENCNKAKTCSASNQQGAGPLLRSSQSEARKAGPLLRSSQSEARKAGPLLRSSQSEHGHSQKIGKQCRAKTDSGDRCRRKAISGQKYCYQHN